MTNPSDKQPAGDYPSGFTQAVLPGVVDPFSCDHEADPPICVCPHDWRITWGNVPKVNRKRNVFVTDSP